MENTHSHSQHFNDVLFATTLQLLTLNLARSRNNVMKISQRIDRRFTLRSTPYWKLSSRIRAQSTNSKSPRGRASPLEFGPVSPWNRAVGEVQKLATMSRW